jgi:hypothetical protein
MGHVAGPARVAGGAYLIAGHNGPAPTQGLPDPF